MTPQEPRPTRPVEYKGEPLDPARGPGLGCFWVQLIALVVLIVLAPLSASWGWPTWISVVLLIGVIVLLLFTGQTMIFLLRLVAASRTEGRRRPLASPSPTVGELEDESGTSRSVAPPHGQAADAPDLTPRDDGPGVRQ